MLLGYEYGNLLVDEKNKDEVVRILRELDTDLIIPQTKEMWDEDMKRLLEIGETKIYKKLLEHRDDFEQ